MSTRSATKADLDGIIEVLISTGICKPDGLRERVSDVIERSPHTCFVTEERGNITGALLATFNGFHLFLSHLAVANEHQGLGVGTSLHARLVERAIELGATGIITDSWLTRAGFYYQLGYRIPGAVFLIKDI